MDILSSGMDIPPKEKLIYVMAIQLPNQVIWYNPTTWQVDWRNYVPFRKEDNPTLTSVTGRVT